MTPCTCPLASSPPSSLFPSTPLPSLASHLENEEGRHEVLLEQLAKGRHRYLKLIGTIPKGNHGIKERNKESYADRHSHVAEVDNLQHARGPNRCGPTP